MTHSKLNNFYSIYAKTALTLVSVITIGYIFILGKEILAPLMFSFLFAVFLMPVTRFFELKCKMTRAAAASLSVIILASVIITATYFLSAQISLFARQWPSFRQTYALTLTKIENWVTSNLHIDVTHQLKYINSETSGLTSSTPFIIGETVLSISSILFLFVFILIDTFFILYYRKLLMKFLIAIFKEHNIPAIADIAAQIKYVVTKYILALFFEIIAVATVCCIIFSLIGMRYALLLGLIMGILNLVPYFGIIAAYLLTILVTIGTGASGNTIFFMSLSVFIIHLSDSNILRPFLIGSRMKINAFVTLLGVVLGQMMWGVAGMLLAMPVIAICKILFDRIEIMKPWGMLLSEDKK
ncbi:MAG: AI-2E family transporter [Rhizobacter sp.]|nr:AI-2E family transporter [Ferruginibacter sp.]